MPPIAVHFKLYALVDSLSGWLVFCWVFCPEKDKCMCVCVCVDDAAWYVFDVEILVRYVYGVGRREKRRPAPLVGACLGRLLAP